MKDFTKTMIDLKRKLTDELYLKLDELNIENASDGIEYSVWVCYKNYQAEIEFFIYYNTDGSVQSDVSVMYITDTLTGKEIQIEKPRFGIKETFKKY